MRRPRGRSYRPHLPEPSLWGVADQDDRETRQLCFRTDIAAATWELSDSFSRSKFAVVVSRTTTGLTRKPVSVVQEVGTEANCPIRFARRFGPRRFDG
jgi:hypothetical protein